MKIFIDSADLEEITQSFQWGLADGVTTNLSLMLKAVQTRKERGEELHIGDYVRKLVLTAATQPISLEVTSTTAPETVEEGRKLYNLFDAGSLKSINIKIPINPASEESDSNQYAGIAAIRELSKEGIPVNCTLIFTPEQALLAAKAGAAYVSPFAGRVDDYLREKKLNWKAVKENPGKNEFTKSSYYPAGGHLGKDGEIVHDQGIVSGVDLVEKCVKILKNYGFKTEVIAASLRNTRQVREVALVGADIATVPFDVIQEMLKHPKTYEGMENFIRDAAEVPEYRKLMQ